FILALIYLPNQGSLGDDGPWLPPGLEFLSGLPTAKRKRRLIIVIQAFLDESGVKGTNPVFTFAGIIGRSERWAQFSDAWQDWLKTPPKIGYLKMNEAAKLIGEFGRFDKHARDKKLARGIRILKDYPQQLIHVNVELADY